MPAGLRRHGLTAPHDLVVIGVDDAPAAALADPPLTVVAPDAEATARHVVGIVTRLLEGRPPLEPPRVMTVIGRRAV